MDLILTSTDKSSKGKLSITVVMTSCAPNLPPFGQSILSSHTLKFRPLSLGNTVFGCGESYIFCRKKEKHAGFIEFTSTPRNVYYYFLMLISLIFFLQICFMFFVMKMFNVYIADMFMQVKFVFKWKCLVKHHHISVLSFLCCHWNLSLYYPISCN